MDNVLTALRPYFQGRTRFALAWIFTAILIFFTKTYPNNVGIAICFLGASLRFISSGFLRKEAALSVGGPYQFTRNPLYLGTLIMGIGAFVSVDAYIMGAVMAIWFTLNYGFVIEHEEEKLPRYFGDAYYKYKQLVPRFLPRLTAPAHADLLKINPDEKIYRFSFSLAKKNKAFEAYASFLGLMGGLALVVFIRNKFGF